MNEFNIEEYFDSFPDDVDRIDVSDEYLNYLPDLSRFKKLKELYCNGNYLTSLPVLPKTLEKLNCGYNGLTLLPNLPENLKVLYCSNNQLTSLPVLPEKLKELYCFNNKLTSLPVLSEKLNELNCSNNQLTLLPNLPENLTELYCSHNNLTSLPVLPEKIKYISYNGNNKLMLLPILPEKLEKLYFYNNPKNKIIVDNYCFKTIKKNIKILNNFRYLYYCLKYRKRFLRIMEPIIKKRYHPRYLYDLKEEDDLDKKLGEW